MPNRFSRLEERISWTNWAALLVMQDKLNAPNGSWGILSDPSYKTGYKKLGAPRIQFRGYIQVRSRRVGMTRTVASRLELNNPPTTVGGIDVDRER